QRGFDLRFLRVEAGFTHEIPRSDARVIHELAASEVRALPFRNHVIGAIRALIREEKIDVLAPPELAINLDVERVFEIRVILDVERLIVEERVIRGGATRGIFLVVHALFAGIFRILAVERRGVILPAVIRVFVIVPRENEWETTMNFAKERLAAIAL